jgi:hypothetical protein
MIKPIARRVRSQIFLLFPALLLALPMFAHSGCGTCAFEDSCFPACATAADCSDGRVCAGVAGFESLAGEPGEVGSPTRCTVSCQRSADCAANGESTCACTDAEGEGVCDGAVADGSPTRVPVCRLDYDPRKACEHLCACVCWHQECEAGLDFDGCVDECAGAYDAFPGCSKELDEYYYCGQRYSVCQLRTEAAHLPYEFNPPLEETCGPSFKALSECAIAPLWKSFFPSAG